MRVNILNRPSPIKEYRYNEFERSGRLSRNRVRDTKGTQYFLFFVKVLVCKIIILTVIILYFWSFIVMGQIRSGSCYTMQCKGKKRKKES